MIITSKLPSMLPMLLVGVYVVSVLSGFAGDHSRHIDRRISISSIDERSSRKKIAIRNHVLPIGSTMSLIHFDIAPTETSWWKLDCADFLENEGAIAVSSFTCTVESGNVTIDQSIAGPHSPQIVGTDLYFWADATNSIAGDTTKVKVRMNLSNGELIPRWVQFNTRVQ
jgi:hypothetical protein